MVTFIRSAYDSLRDITAYYFVDEFIYRPSDKFVLFESTNTGYIPDFEFPHPQRERRQSIYSFNGRVVLQEEFYEEYRKVTSRAREGCEFVKVNFFPLGMGDRETIIYSIKSARSISRFAKPPFASLPRYYQDRIMNKGKDPRSEIPDFLLKVSGAALIAMGAIALSALWIKKRF